MGIAPSPGLRTPLEVAYHVLAVLCSLGREVSLMLLDASRETIETNVAI